jgi:putative phage-type endonuclease
MGTALKVAGLTEEQQQIRSTGIGASEVAALLGLNRYKSVVDIWARKLHLVPDEECGEPARWGNRLEAVIADAYAEEEGIDPGLLVQLGTLRHPEHPLLLATPDRIRLNSGHLKAWDRNVQIKTASLRVADRWGEGEDDIPEEYLAQINAEMAVTGLDSTDLPVLIGGNEMRIYRIRADAEFQEMIIDEVERFWRNYVVPQRQPPVDGSERWGEFFKKRYPKDTRPLLPATDEARELLEALGRARRARELDEATEAEAINRLKNLCGDAAGIEGICTWRRTKDGTKTDYEALAKFLKPSDAAIAEFTTVKPGFRRFLPKLPKEK